VLKLPSIPASVSSLVTGNRWWVQLSILTFARCQAQRCVLSAH
jgi:hypothetical protein